MPEQLITAPLLRRFVGGAVDAADPAAVGALYAQLAARPLPDHAALVAWIRDWDEVTALADEVYNAAYITMSCNTADSAAEAHYLRVLEELLPVLERNNFQLQRKLLDAPAVGELDAAQYGTFLREVRARVELFREENVALQTDVQKMEQEYDKITGSQMVDFRGEQRTMQQMGLFLEENERAVREEAWRARDAVRAADEAALDDLYDRMVPVRQQIARNAGYANYRDYIFADKLRFDYTPTDCLAFHAAIERHVVPVVTEFNARRRRLLGYAGIRPWDTQVDPAGQPPIRPFREVDDLIAGCRRIFTQLDPQLSGFYNEMVAGQLLDLGSRPGKAPGGYMTSLAERRVPFIFMNAVGLKRDVDTLLHEGGHAFHYFLAREQPLQSYHHTGSEFAEVASMSMEFLARPYLGEFYTPEQLAHLGDDQIRDTLSFLPFMAMIDAFQHWVYTTDQPDAAARRAKWAELEARFRPDVDWRGLEGTRDSGWQYPHVFGSPFYYVEYGIAQLAALRIWLNSLTDERGAVQAYKQALALGGSRPLPDLFQAAGAEFGLDDRIVGEIVRGAVAQIANA